MEEQRQARYPRWLEKDRLGFATETHRSASVDQACLAEIRRRAESVDEYNGQPIYQVAGRVINLRRSGKSLVFFDIRYNDRLLQVQINRSKLSKSSSSDSLWDGLRQIRRGDHISVRGISAPMDRSVIEERQIVAIELPLVRSTCIERLPVELEIEERITDKEVTVGRHVEMLTYPDMMITLKVRALIIQSLRRQLERDDFLEVQTPILSASAGGASARPFLTSATEFNEKILALRIAPELWLKRLVIGGVSQVFEIGPSFRNEGLDRTHNPEFTTCEFYATYLNIERLISYTEQLLSGICESITSAHFATYCDLELVEKWEKASGQAFKQIDFIPATNAHLGQPLPNLAAPEARDQVLTIFHEQSIPIPHPPTLPRLLDKLSSHYLEPQCSDPTWIINIPECMSPLSKSFIHPTAPNSQPVAARAELYMSCKEVVNCYEEENSPFEQRRKFLDQQRYGRDPDSSTQVDDEAMEVDEDYLSALEWGLPPTGGWGCGIDRLVMLVMGIFAPRITDVLSFGNLRAVTRNAQKWETKADQPYGTGDKLDKSDSG